MVTGEAAYRVDLDELDAAATALAQVCEAARRAGASILDGVASCDGWAADDQVRWAYERLCRSLGWAVGQAEELTGTLRAGVQTAAREYAEAEASARLDPRDAAAARGR